MSPNITTGPEESSTTKTSKDELSMDSLTIIWYITTFIALLGYFSSSIEISSQYKIEY